MKTKLSKILIAVAVLTFVGCDNGKSDKKEVVAAPAGIPQGRVTAQNDQNSFCDIGPTSMTCTDRGNQCTPQFSYTDLATMCHGVQSALKSFSITCGQIGLNAVLAQRCGGVLPNTPGQPGFPHNPISQQPLGPNFHEIKCEFDTYRSVQHKVLFLDFPSQTGTGLIQTTLLIDRQNSILFDLRNIFGIDIGKFGLTQLTFTPANLKGSADTITLSNKGLNGEIKMVQSGFAGNEVRIEAQDDSGSLRLMVACKGLGNFKRVASAKTATQYVCKGKSDLGYKNEEIEIALPYNASLIGTETELAEGLTMSIQDEQVQLTAAGVGGDVTVQTSAFLKEKLQLTINDALSDVNVTCSPK